MFDFIKKIFGGNSIDYKTLIENGVQIIDVRMPSEFSKGNIKGSLNIPLQSISKSLENVDKKRPVITCCASGIRSISAKFILEKQGYEVYNGGAWSSLQRKIS